MSDRERKTRARKRAFGTIRKQGKRYAAWYTHPYIPFIEAGDGTARQNFVRPGKTFERKTGKDSAQAWLSAEEARINSGTWTHPDERKAKAAEAEAQAKRDALTFGEYAAKWIETRSLAPSTLRKYREYLDSHILPRWGDTRLADITTPDMLAWLPTVAPGHRKTRQRVLETMRAILNTAVKIDRLIPFNPVFGELLDNIKHPEAKPQRREVPELTLADVETLANAMPAHTADLVRLMGHMGLRTGEARELRGGDIATDSKGRVTVAIRRDVTGHGKDLSINDRPKTEAGQRTLYAPAHLAQRLQALADTAGKDGLLFHRAGHPEQTLSEETFRSQLTRTAKRLDLPHVWPHALRAIYTAGLYRLRLPENVIQAALGHAPVNITQHYGRATAEDLATLADMVSRAAFPEYVPDVADLDARRQA